jgi:hypothetical protein
MISPEPGLVFIAHDFLLSNAGGCQKMGTALWFVWFWFSRKFTYLAILGLWIFSGLACLVGGPGRPNPPAIYSLFWALETIALIPLVLLYTRYNVAVFIRMTGRATRQAASFTVRELDKL